MKILALALSLLYPMTPNANQTPGRKCKTTDADFTEYRYEEQIPYCKRNVATSTKTKIYNAYHIASDDREQYTIDHLIPLSLGGSNSVENLWPEAKALKARYRPTLEDDLYVLIRDGEITQQEALDCIYLAKFQLKECPALLSGQ